MQNEQIENINNAPAAAEKSDMLHGPMFKKILLFALPLALSGILQQLFTSADMAVVYWFEGSVAQSAVNSNGALVNLLINLFSGLSVGSTVLVAEHIGKKNTDDLHSVVLTSVVIALVSGVALTALGIGVSAPLLRLMNTPQDTLPLATEYLRIYFIGMPFLMVYNFGAAILRGVGDTKMPLIVLLSTGGVNIGLNILFVGACKMSVAGVAVATVICNVLCAVMAIWFLMRSPIFRMRKGSRVRGEYIKKIAVIGVPAGLQGVVFSISNVLIQSAINEYGARAVAGTGDAINFENYAYFFVYAFATAAVTFYGQNYAAGEYGRCRTALKICMLSAFVISLVLSVVFTAGGRLFIRIYTDDEVAIEYALMRMWCALIFMPISCLYEVAGGALRGMGHSLLPTVLTVIGSCILRIVWIYTVYAAFKSYWMLTIIYPITWAITGVAMLISYYVISRKAGFYGRKTVAVPSAIAAEAACAATEDTDREWQAESESDLTMPSEDDNCKDTICTDKLD